MQICCIYANHRQGRIRTLKVEMLMAGTTPEIFCALSHALRLGTQGSLIIKVDEKTASMNPYFK